MTVSSIDDVKPQGDDLVSAGPEATDPLSADPVEMARSLADQVLKSQNQAVARALESDILDTVMPEPTRAVDADPKTAELSSTAFDSISATPIPVDTFSAVQKPVAPQPSNPVAANPVSAEPVSAAFFHGRVNEPIEEPTPTAEMSLALEDLGFVPEEVLEPTSPDLRRPEADQAPEPDVQQFASDTWNATDEIAPLVLPGPLAADPAPRRAAEVPEVTEEPEASRPERASEPAPDPAPAIAPEPVPVVVPDPTPAVAPEIVVPTISSPPVGAPPVTGELNWEQLMWEATQEAAQETQPADDSDRPKPTGDAPSEEY